MGKPISACCDNKDGLKKGPWTAEEDKKLLDYIERHGHGSWRALPEKAGLQRCGKSCRLRWRNYLRPDIKRGKFSWQEEQTIIQLHALLGNRWSTIANMLPKRTDNEIKNHWNTHLKKRLIKMGIDPVTHKPKTNALVTDGGGGGRTTLDDGINANLNHIAQWESARVEAEARLVRESKLIKSINSSSPNYNNKLRIMSKAAELFRPLPSSSSSSSSSFNRQPLFIPPPCLDHVFKAAGHDQPEWKNQNHHVLLESPTSCLQFSDNNVPITVLPSPADFGENPVFFRATTDDQVKKVTMMMNVNPPHDQVSVDESSSFMEDLIINGDLIGWNDDAQEIFNVTGIYNNNNNNNLGSNGFCSTGNLEDNIKYWNTMVGDDHDKAAHKFP